MKSPRPNENPAPAAAPALKGRRNDLDWLRIGAFGLLILYHIELVYGPFDWHIQSDHRVPWIRELLLVTSPWRLTLLFLISGAALRFMCRSRTATQIASSRLWRLIPPLVFGVVFLVPVQSWIEAMDKGYWTDSLFAWWKREFSPAGIANGVPVNHLWFLVYICVYSLAALPLIARPDRIRQLETWLENQLTGWRVLLIPFAYLAAIRIFIYPMFWITNSLPTDWYNHALSFGAFVFGFLIVGRDRIWRELEKARWVALTIALCALPVVMLQDIHPGGRAFMGVPKALVVATDQWATIAAILGFASRHLRNASSPVLTYLNDAIFPCYLAHQTVLVLTMWLIKPAHLPAPVEFSILFVMTFGGSLLTYEAVKRIPPMRPLWGLKRRTAADRPPRFNRRRLLLAIAMAAPVAALASVMLAMAAYPGYNHATQYLSELGGATASSPMIFNAGVMASGFMAALAGVGFGLAIVALTRARFAGALTAIVFALAGVGMAMAAVYPWPDPRHMAINLGLGIQIAPLLIIWGLWPRRDLSRLKLFLALVFAAMAVMTVITKHLVFQGLVNDANVGWWERAYAVILVGWVGVAAYFLDRRLQQEPA